jgi:hypothetical protein
MSEQPVEQPGTEEEKGSQDGAVTVESLLVALKQKEKQCQKLEKLQSKLEERYKEKVKAIKDA